MKPNTPNTSTSLTNSSAPQASYINSSILRRRIPSLLPGSPQMNNRDQRSKLRDILSEALSIIDDVDFEFDSDSSSDQES